MRRLLWSVLIAVVVAGIGVGGALYVGVINLTELEELLDPEDLHRVARLLGPPNIPHIIVLERGGAEVAGGVDDSQHNISSVVGAKQPHATIPKFDGSDKQWRDFVRCLDEVFAPFDVKIVESRPKPDAGSYVLVLVGGTPGMIGYEKKIVGLSPYSGDVVDDPIAFVFSKTIKDDPTVLCETAAEEIGHTYGLDHEYNCKDPMTYLTPCRPQRFQNVDASCGEFKKRPCKVGPPTQNSYAHLLSVLGPNPTLKPKTTTPPRSAAAKK